MSAATGTILTIGALGANAGLQLWGAKKGSDAAKKASEQQQQSAQQALALQRDMYQTTRGDLAPYREQGGQGLTALTALLGLPPGQAAAPGGVQAPSGFGPAVQGMATAFGAPKGGPVPFPAAAGQGQSAYGGAPGAAGGMVLLKAPNGQTRPVPAQFADYYLARGATRG